MTDKAYLKSLRAPTSQDPLRVLVSSCLMGTLCGADGSSYGQYPHVKSLKERDNVSITHFCPEHYSFGTPREIPDIDGGHGGDVLDGHAKVISQSGKDLTEGMVNAAHEMLKLAKSEKIEVAIMMDVSAACGSQVIYSGHRLSDPPEYQIGMGVCAELLTRNGFKVISQRDYRSLDILMTKIDPTHQPNPDAIDHNETDWYKEYFKI
ncbi:MAG: DUF523 domain-containing protein [Bacteroidota bacterium]